MCHPHLSGSSVPVCRCPLQCNGVRDFGHRDGVRWRESRDAELSGSDVPVYREILQRAVRANGVRDGEGRNAVCHPLLSGAAVPVH